MFKLCSMKYVPPVHFISTCYIEIIKKDNQYCILSVIIIPACNKKKTNQKYNFYF